MRFLLLEWPEVGFGAVKWHVKSKKKKKEKTHGPSIVKKSSTFKDATIKQKRQ